MGRKTLRWWSLAIPERLQDTIAQGDQQERESAQQGIRALKHELGRALGKK